MKLFPTPLCIVILTSVVFAPMAFGQTIFSDDFNRADSTTLGTDWSQDNNGTNAEASISTNELLLSAPALTDESRAIVNIDISGSSAAILPAGGFEISFDFTPGVDYTTGVHGGYGLQVYLGPEAFVSNAGAGFGNNNHGLRYQIRGNGSVFMRDENGDVTNSSVSGWTNLAPTTFNLVVNTDTFGTNGGTNSATLTVGGNTVFSDVSFGQWTTADDLFFAVEAYSDVTVGSSTIDNLSIDVVPEPSSGLLLGLGLATLFLRHRRQAQQALRQSNVDHQIVTTARCVLAG